MNSSTKKIILSSLFMALICVATLSIRIPTPGTNGYIHPGDAVVILSGIVLGPVFGFLSAGLGSCLSDLLGGYLTYVPVTFLIKGLIAFLSACIYKKLAGSPKSRWLAVGLGGLLDMALVAGGYGLFEFLLYGPGALASVPANLIQGAGGLVLSLVLYPILTSVPEVQHMIQKNTARS